MDNDDLPVGRIMTRREVVTLLGVSGAALIAGATFGQTETEPPACVVTPELTEGPYFVDEMLNRSDIRSDPITGEIREGALLTLALRVFQIGNVCQPLSGAVVDLWHCDALGVYSGVRDPGFDTSGQQWLRGYQLSDENGLVTFTTIYPGWYQGRAVHIHFKVRTEAATEQGLEFTSQFFFDEDTTDVVHAQEPYAAKGYRTLKNEGDGIFQRGGEQLILPVSESGDGYAAAFDIGLYTD